MNKRSHKQLKSRHWLIIMVIICVGLVVTSLATHLVAAPIRAVAGYVITPFQNAINDIGNYFVDQSGGFQDVKALAEENDALKKEIAQLTEQNNLLIQDQDKLERLEELYNLDQSYTDAEKVAAEVISKDPGNWYTTFVINKGARDGIEVDMNVIGDGGLIGIVTETGDNWAQVRSIMDDESNVSVMISYNANTFTMTGSLLEKNNGKLEYIQLNDPNNEVGIGDPVVTSNISSKFMPGILVGYIGSVEENANELTKSGTIIPVADFTKVREVLVVTSFKQTKENS